MRLIVYFGDVYEPKAKIGYGPASILADGYRVMAKQRAIHSPVLQTRWTIGTVILFMAKKSNACGFT
jgi:hypothetical protein